MVDKQEINMNSQERYVARIQERREGTDRALLEFCEYGFEIFEASELTAKAHMEQAARDLARHQSKERIEMMIAALQKAIK
jgi:DNA-binding helix-hairpin-helix protein with protein kinase domain